ncbi:MAG: flagellar basal body P-ring formation protein FlgA [Betaproteobacteria bacterium]|nr:flagellar basal body P-ring formation protein FlgA [Betaproteobacteria bacterium]MDE2131210.1 flagellar basal body P-ring formation protein FlgA [Betaproteobacteria bacterium]MDE2211208.1 flagellar basal body P-ring formation protein FlgA [Betaproteobacteria bacterium]
MKSKRWISGLLVLASFSAFPERGQDQEALLRTVTDFVQGQIRSFPGKAVISVEHLDPRLNLASCPAPEPFIPPGGHLLGHGSVGIRCAKPDTGAPWTIYVPVQVTLRTVMLVARKPLSAEKVLSADDIAEQNGEATRPDILTDPSQAIGKVVKQGLGAGQVLRRDMLRDPYAIRQGQSVQVQVEGKGFRISTEGQAMGNAAEGQSVQIRTASGRLVAGTAYGNGLVRVSP